MTPIRDQDGCGSCWAFAAVGDMEAQYQISKVNPSSGIDLSEQNVLQCSGGTCGGSSITVPLDYLRDYGTPDEACNPYNAADHPCGTGRCSDYASRTYKITGWTWIATDTANVKTYLYTHGPVIVWMNVYSNFPWYDASFWQSYYYGHAHTACDVPTGCGHFVVIVGWNDGGWWVVRNSWGTSGGDVNDYGGGSHGGYFYMSMATTDGFFDPATGWGEAAVISDVTEPASNTVTFKTNPTSWSGSAGSITVDGSSTYTNGQTGSYSGDHNIVVNVPSGYQFVWVAGNRNPPQSDPTGVYVPNISANPTTMDVNGNGWLKATFAAVITFHTNTGTGSISYGSQLYTDGQTRAEANLPPDYGNTVQITANPPSGALFVSWSVSGMLTVDSTSSQTTTLHVNGPGTLTANFNVAQTIPVSSAGTDVVNAPADSVIYVLPDWQTGASHTKPPGVQPALLSDFTALGFMFGASSSTQIMVLDTNSTYFDPTTGAPKISNGVLVVFAGPIVNGVVRYYEGAGVSPLKFHPITVDGTQYYAWYDRQGNVVASMPSSAGGGASDMFLLEYFLDANNNKVFIIYGFAWKGTYVGGVFFKTYILPNIASATHGWYVFQWDDVNGNGLPDPYEVNTTPVNYGD